MNERERLGRRFDRIQQIENPVCAAVTLAGTALYFLYRLIVNHSLGEFLIVPPIVILVFAKLVFALWSARIASALRAAPPVPFARATQASKSQSIR